MQGTIGQRVLEGKDFLSPDPQGQSVHTGGMAKDVRKDIYLDEFLERVRQARKRHYRSQTLIAERMGLEQDKYKQYESRSFLPHYMIPLFCDLCHITADWLFTGQGERVMGPIPEPKQRPTKKTPTRQIRRVA